MNGDPINRWTINNQLLATEIIRQLQEERSVVIRVRGNSMRPFLRDDIDLVTIEAKRNSLKCLDLVLFVYGDKYLLHRIVKMKNNIFFIRGDNNKSMNSEQIYKEKIIGIVTSVKRRNKEIKTNTLIWKIGSFIWVKTHRIRVIIYCIKHHLYIKRNELKI